MTGPDIPRPLRADAVRNRARVLEAARAVFGAEGLDVSLDDIARRAGVGAGTVYRHFASKQALFDAVVADRMAELANQGRALGEASDPGHAFFSFLRLLVREAALKRDLVEAFATAGVTTPVVETSVAYDLFGALAELLGRAQSARAVRRDVDLDDLLAVLTGTAVAISRSGADDERTERLLDIMCAGLRAAARG